MNKHTPGPWAARLSASGNHFIYSDERQPAVAGVANTAKGIDDDEAAANAHLIAAAPELLAALAAVLDRFERGRLTYEGGDSESDKAISAVYEAIAKARGRA